MNENMDSGREIRLPASKSIGARFLVASYFAGTLAQTPEFNDCDDLRVIRSALMALRDAAASPAGEGSVIDVHASGTAFRFMTAAAASTPGVTVTVTGTPRLCSRPMSPLVEALHVAGGCVAGQGADATGPYLVEGRRFKGGELSIRGDVSSQFVSALMLVAPCWERGMDLRFTTPLVSRPYVEMTAAVMRRFGIDVSLREDGVDVKPGRYVSPGGFRVEADWSAAGFFYEAASLMDSEIEIAGLAAPGESLQGDSLTASVFGMLGVGSRFSQEGAVVALEDEMPDEVEVDMTDTPDLVPAFATACALNDCRFHLTGVRNLRVKECDRLAAIQAELGKLGYVLTVEEDSISWHGEMCQPLERFEFETYDDHRIAMALSMAAFKVGEVFVKNPDVVDKSFSDFWNQLPKVGLACDCVIPDIMRVTLTQD